MSRRITLFVLAAWTVLSTTQARADRECSENSCHLPQAVEPPTAPPASAKNNQAANRESARKLPVAAAPRSPELAPLRIAAPRLPLEEKPAPIYAKAGSAPVRELTPIREAASHREVVADNSSSSRPARMAERAYARETRSSGSLIVSVPAANYGAEGVAPVQPFVLYTGIHAPRFYVLAPNAKIISIGDGN